MKSQSNFIKSVAVIDSCVTYPQVLVAWNFVMLAWGTMDFDNYRLLRKRWEAKRNELFLN